MKICCIEYKEDKNSKEMELKEDRWKKEMHDAIGIRHIFDLCVKHRVPVVIHNGFLDILHIFKSFIEDLPNHPGEFRNRLHDHLPFIFDTKNMLHKIFVADNKKIQDMNDNNDNNDNNENNDTINDGDEEGDEEEDEEGDEEEDGEEIEINNNDNNNKDENNNNANKENQTKEIENNIKNENEVNDKIEMQVVINETIKDENENTQMEIEKEKISIKIKENIKVEKGDERLYNVNELQLRLNMLTHDKNFISNNNDILTNFSLGAAYDFLKNDICSVLDEEKKMKIDAIDINNLINLSFDKIPAIEVRSKLPTVSQHDNIDNNNSNNDNDNNKDKKK